MEQYNVIIDVLGGGRRTSTECSMLKMLGKRGKKLLATMQKAVTSNSLSIGRTFKIVI